MTMFTTIAKTFTFDAAHHLPTMPEGHKCRRLHGHTYRVDVVLRGKVDAETGILLDYGQIARAWEGFHDILDHQLLNDIPGLEVPTTENLVAWVFGHWHRFPGPVWDVLHSIRIHESASTWCEMSKVEWLAFCGPMS
jgi:6-pyruvoyltetrahydropterin/6-carboxytetrahydropterin synthase